MHNVPGRDIVHDVLEHKAHASFHTQHMENLPVADGRMVARQGIHENDVGVSAIIHTNRCEFIQKRRKVKIILRIS